MTAPLRDLARKVLSASLRARLRTGWTRLRQRPPIGWIRWGSLRRVKPIGSSFSVRGKPVDRYYIEQFLAAHAADVKGRVLEVEDSSYTRRFGGERVSRSDVLHSPLGLPAEHSATLVADLTDASGFPEAAFDCFILTQTLLFIYDLEAAVATVYRTLKPGGVVLVSVPGISQIVRGDQQLWGQYWSFTRESAQRIFESAFPANCVHTEVFGNVMSATAFLHNVATEELRRAELDFRDPEYEVIICVRAVKPG